MTIVYVSWVLKGSKCEFREKIKLFEIARESIPAFNEDKSNKREKRKKR